MYRNEFDSYKGLQPSQPVISLSLWTPPILIRIPKVTWHFRNWIRYRPHVTGGQVHPQTFSTATYILDHWTVCFSHLLQLHVCTCVSAVDDRKHKKKLQNYPINPNVVEKDKPKLIPNISYIFMAVFSQQNMFLRTRINVNW